MYLVMVYGTVFGEYIWFPHHICWYIFEKANKEYDMKWRVQKNI